MLKKATSCVLDSKQSSTYPSEGTPPVVSSSAALLGKGARLGAPVVGECNDDLFEHPMESYKDIIHFDGSRTNSA